MPHNHSMRGLRRYPLIAVVCVGLCVWIIPKFFPHVPVLVTKESPVDKIQIEDPELSQAFYGSMHGFPHTFEIVATKPFTLFTQILVPDIDSSKNTISGIIIKELKSGRVEEVSPLTAKDAAWEKSYEPFGGDTYRKGPSFEGNLEPGVYRIEVHTPDNLEKYVLVVGKREDLTLGYLELLRRVTEVKEFFEKSQFRIIESPLVYIPLILLISAVGVWYGRRKSRVY